MARWHDATPADESRGGLFGWLGNGRAGRRLAPAARQAQVIAQARRLFGPEAGEPSYYAELNWANEAYTHATPGHLVAEQEQPVYGHPLLQAGQRRCSRADCTGPARPAPAGRPDGSAA